jgi:hypothetical protein
MVFLLLVEAELLDIWDHKNMLECTTQWVANCLLVTFKTGQTILLQADGDITKFCRDCKQNIENATDITKCPDYYFDLVE